MAPTIFLQLDAAPVAATSCHHDVVDTLCRRLDASHPEVAYGLSGLGFRSYFFAPADNYNWLTVYPGVTWHPASLELDHFGATESLSVHYGRDIRRFRGSVTEQMALARRESQAARPMLAASADGGPLLEITGAKVVARPPTEGHWLQTGTDGPSPLAWVLVVQPGFEVIPDSRRRRLQLDVLHYARLHADSGREISSEYDVQVASGLRAWHEAARWLGEGEAARSESALAFARTWLRTLTESRRHAAGFLAGWARGLSEGNSWWADVSGGAAALGVASAAYAVTADALEGLGSLGALELATTDPAELAAALHKALVHEARALDLLGLVHPRAADAWF
jgi:hypothetical protein